MSGYLKMVILNVNIEQSPGCKKLIQKHDLKVPKVGLLDEPKVKTNEWFWLECDEFHK